MSIGIRLKQLRENANLTQEEVGKKIGVSKATVNRYETGEIDIKRTIAIKLSEVFNVSPSYIMEWDNNMQVPVHNPEQNTLHNNSDKTILDLYNQLDTEDKAEIRGEIKQMLKADKYAEKDALRRA